MSIRDIIKIAIRGGLPADVSSALPTPAQVAQATQMGWPMLVSPERSSCLCDYEDSGGFARRTRWFGLLIVGPDWHGHNGVLTRAQMPSGVWLEGRMQPARTTGENIRRRFVGHKGRLFTLEFLAARDLYRHGDLQLPGFVCGADRLGCFFRAANGSSYHPTAQEWCMSQADLARRVRQATAASWARKRELEAVERQKAEILADKTTYVTIRDSLQAGNCLHGTLGFAKQRFRIRSVTEPDALRGGHLIGVPATKLLQGAAKLPEFENIKAAIITAWQRETTVCI